MPKPLIVLKFVSFTLAAKLLLVMKGLTRKALVFFLLSIILQSVSAQISEINIDSLKKSIQSVDLKTVREEEQSEILEILEQKDQEIENWKSLTFYNGSKLVPCLSKLRVYEVLEEIELYGMKSAKRHYLVNSDDISIDSSSNGAIKTVRFLLLHSEYEFENASYQDRIGYQINEMIRKNRLFFEKRYPVFIQLKKSGQIVFQKKEVISDRVHGNEVKRVSFPPLIISGKTPIEKERLSEKYIKLIREILSLDEFYQYSISTYLELEKTEVPDGDVDKLLKIRVAFIKVLKKEYEKKKE